MVRQLTITTDTNAKTDGVTNFTTTFAFNEPTTGFTVADVTVDNGTRASSFVSTNSDNTSFVALVITPDANQGDVAITVAAGRLTDLAGNNNALNSLAVEDETAPTVTVVSHVSVCEPCKMQRQQNSRCAVPKVVLFL